MKLTIKVKLLTDDKQRETLTKMMEAFNDACNHVSGVAYENGKFGKVFLQHLLYYHLRKEYNLPSQLAVRAVGKVNETYQTTKCIKFKRVEFKKHSAVVLDNRLYGFKGLDALSIITLDGRILVPVQVGEYAQLRQRRMRGQADLILVDGVFYLCVVVEQPDGEPIETSGWLGVDMGIVNIATTSDGQQWSGKEIDDVRERTVKQRAGLQQCGSRRARQKLKRIGRKVSRFVRNVNHVISKKIVSVAKALNLGMAIEALRKIETTVRKAQRLRFGCWSFYQLAQFLQYKCVLAGLPFCKVNPAYTSRTCRMCGYCSKDNRKNQALFACQSCGHTENADCNASWNIGAKAYVNEPMVAIA